MTERATRFEVWSYIERVLQNTEVAEKGHIVCAELSSGELVMGQTAEGLIPIGTAEESFTGNGTKKLRVRLFKDVVLHRFANDSAPNDVADSDFLSPVYLKDSQTVSTLATGRSVAGRVWGVTSAGVLIEPAISIGVQGIPGEDA